MRALWFPDCSESHEDIIEKAGLRERNVRGEYTFCRVEVTPVDRNYELPLEEWRFTLDQDVTPAWWDVDKAEKCCRVALAEWAKAKIVRRGETRESITEGKHLTYVGGTVNRIDGGTVERINGGTVNRINGGTVEYIYGGTVNRIEGGTVECINGGTVERINGGTVVTYTDTITPQLLTGPQAVLINRSGDTPVCTVGPPKKESA